MWPSWAGRGCEGPGLCSSQLKCHGGTGPGLILAPLGFYLTTSILGKLPLGKYREGSGVGGLGQVLEAAGPH